MINLLGAYVRVSDDKLKSDGERRQDVGRQVEKITKFCETMGWGVPEFFIDDGKSAFKEDYNSRPEFCRMLREIRANRKNRIVVEDLTRWSRRIEDGLKTLKEVGLKNCNVTSMSEGEVDITLSDGWAKSVMFLFMAEYSSRIQSDKVTSGMKRRLKDPKAICGSCGVVHLGRHPSACECDKCTERKGRAKRSLKYKEKRSQN